jgi:hypothetical protein
VWGRDWPLLALTRASLAEVRANKGQSREPPSTADADDGCGLDRRAKGSSWRSHLGVQPG